MSLSYVLKLLEHEILDFERTITIERLTKKLASQKPACFEWSRTVKLTKEKTQQNFILGSDECYCKHCSILSEYFSNSNYIRPIIDDIKSFEGSLAFLSWFSWTKNTWEKYKIAIGYFVPERWKWHYRIPLKAYWFPQLGHIHFQIDNVCDLSHSTFHKERHDDS